MIFVIVREYDENDKDKDIVRIEVKSSQIPLVVDILQRVIEELLERKES